MVAIVADGVHRYARHDLYAAWGRLEALVVPLGPTAFEALDDHGRSVDGVLATLTEELVADARSARAAALA
jgi:hypothetical protein